MTWTGVRTWVGLHPQAVAMAAGTMIAGWLTMLVALETVDVPRGVGDHLLGWSFALVESLCLALGYFAATLRLRGGLDTRPLITSFLRWPMLLPLAGATFASAALVAMAGGPVVLTALIVCLASAFCLMSVHALVILGVAAAYVARWIAVRRGRWEVGRPANPADLPEINNYAWPKSAALRSTALAALLVIVGGGALFVPLFMLDRLWHWGDDLLAICGASALSWLVLLCCWMTVVRRSIDLRNWPIIAGTAAPLVLFPLVMVGAAALEGSQEMEGTGFSLSLVLAMAYTVACFATTACGMAGVILGSLIDFVGERVVDANATP